MLKRARNDSRRILLEIRFFLNTEIFLPSLTLISLSVRLTVVGMALVENVALNISFWYE